MTFFVAHISGVQLPNAVFRFPLWLIYSKKTRQYQWKIELKQILSKLRAAKKCLTEFFCHFSSAELFGCVLRFAKPVRYMQSRDILLFSIHITNITLQGTQLIRFRSQNCLSDEYQKMRSDDMQGTKAKKKAKDEVASV